MAEMNAADNGESAEIFATLIVALDGTAHEDTWPAITLIRGSGSELTALVEEFHSGGLRASFDRVALTVSEFREHFDYLIPTPEEAQAYQQKLDDDRRQRGKEERQRAADEDQQLEAIIAKYGNATVEELKAMRHDPPATEEMVSMDASTPVICPSCFASRWHVTYHESLDHTIEYTMTVPGAVDEPRETSREVEEGFDFACAVCGQSADEERDDALREQARRVSLDQDGKIDWQSEPGD